MSAGEQVTRAVNAVPRATAQDQGGAPVEIPASDPGVLLSHARDAALRMLAADGRAATALRIRVGDVSVEMEWDNEAGSVTAPSSLGQAAARELPGEEGEPSGGFLTAHTVGCFYYRPTPDALPFVAEGDVVTAGQQVAIIEAMKLMLPVEVEQDCRIGAVLVGDGETVAFGDRLFALESLVEN